MKALSNKSFLQLQLILQGLLIKYIIFTPTASLVIFLFLLLQANRNKEDKKTWQQINNLLKRNGGSEDGRHLSVTAMATLLQIIVIGESAIVVN